MLPDGLRHRAHFVPYEARLLSGRQLGRVDSLFAAGGGVHLFSTCLVRLTTMILSGMPTESIVHVCVFGSNFLTDPEPTLVVFLDQRACAAAGQDATGVNLTSSRC